MSIAGPVSVGVSTVDRPDALARCLDGLLAGAVQPDEILIVDQGRDASTEAVIRERRGHYPELRHIRQPLRGLSAARNTIMEQARNGVVAVTDDDCVPDTQWLAAITGALARAPYPEAVTGQVLALAPEGDRTFAISLRTDERPVDFTRETIPWHVGTGANFAVRRDVLARVGGYDKRLGAGSDGQAAEDLDLLLRLLRAGARVRYAPDAIIYHERQSKARRLATRWSYAHGIGALAGMLLRRYDRFATTLLAATLREALKRLAGTTLRRDYSGIHQALLSIGGTISGVAYGWRAETGRQTEVRNGHSAGV